MTPQAKDQIADAVARMQVIVLEEDRSLGSQVDTIALSLHMALVSLESVLIGEFRYNMGDYEQCARTDARLALRHIYKRLTGNEPEF